MGKYIITIDEKSESGKALKQLLSRDKNVSLTSVKDFDKAFDKLLETEMKNGVNEPWVSYDTAKKEIARMKKRLAK